MVLRLGVVGVGRWGSAHMERIASSPDCELVAIADPAAGSGHDVPVYRSAREMVDSEALDGAIIATPPESHVADFEGVVERGVNVMVEKPLATSLDGLARVRRLATDFAGVVLVGHVLRYEGVVLAALDAIRGRAIGQVTRVSVAYTKRLGRPRPLSELLSDGVHVFDLLELLLGCPLTRVRALSVGRHDDDCLLHAHYGAVLASIVLSRHVGRQRTITVTGTIGELRIDLVARRLSILPWCGPGSDEDFVDGDALSGQLGRFVDLIGSGDGFFDRRAAHAVEVACLAQQSRGEWVDARSR